MINEQKLEKTLLLLGFRDNIIGTEYLRKAIRSWRPGIQYTKCVYPVVAREVGSTPARVERSIRTAIETACERGSYSTLVDIFGYSVNPDTGKPTNSEFIARIARYCDCEN